MKKEAAVIRPAKGVKENNFRQSRYEGVAKCPFRAILSSRSAGGKTTTIFNVITDFYGGSRPVFDKVYIFSRSVFLDPLWIKLSEWCEQNMEYEEGETFRYTTIREEVLERIFDERKKRIDEERRQKKHYLSQILVVIDDMSDAYELQARRENPVSGLYYGGRHWGISVISSVHALSSLNPPARKSAYMLCIYRIAAGSELEFVIDQYAALVGGRDIFLQMYNEAVKEPYSFLTIFPNEPLEKMFQVRFEHRILLESPEDLVGEEGGG